MRALRNGALSAAIIVLAAACSGPGATHAPTLPGTAGAPIGAWTVTVTTQDFERAGLTDAGANQENSGAFTFTINADGTFTEAQQADHPVRWPVFKGSWTALGADQMQLRTTFPADFAGETLVVGWKLEADGLHLRLISPDDPYVRAHFETRPWSPAP